MCITCNMLLCPGRHGMHRADGALGAVEIWDMEQQGVKPQQFHKEINRLRFKLQIVIACKIYACKILYMNEAYTTSRERTSFQVSPRGCARETAALASKRRRPLCQACCKLSLHPSVRFEVCSARENNILWFILVILVIYFIICILFFFTFHVEMSKGMQLDHPRASERSSCALRRLRRLSRYSSWRRKLLQDT